MLHHYERQLSAASTLAQIGPIVRSAARLVAHADGATFVLREGDLCFYADEDAIGPLWKGQRFPMSECLSGWAMLHRQAVAVPDIETDVRVPLAAYRPTFVRSMIMVPINRAAPVGAIGAYWATTGSAAHGCTDSLLALADATAEALDRVGLADAPWAPNFRLRGGDGLAVG